MESRVTYLLSQASATAKAWAIVRRHFRASGTTLISDRFNDNDTAND